MPTNVGDFSDRAPNTCHSRVLRNACDLAQGLKFALVTICVQQCNLLSTCDKRLTGLDKQQR